MYNIKSQPLNIMVNERKYWLVLGNWDKKREKRVERSTSTDFLHVAAITRQINSKCLIKKTHPFSPPPNVYSNHRTYILRHGLLPAYAYLKLLNNTILLSWKKLSMKLFGKILYTFFETRINYPQSIYTTHKNHITPHVVTSCSLRDLLQFDYNNE